jgi:carboxymethylenebutenolidase
MTDSNEWMTVPTHDGGQMPGFVARPTRGAGPGIVLLQEIFGITEYIQSRARDLAALGYTVLVPELYWRMGAHLSTDETTQAGLQEAFGLFSKLDMPKAVDDAIAAVEYVRAMPNTNARAGVLGFCLGGRLAYEVGVHDAPDVVVSYYGSGIADRLEDAAQLECPVIFHFGGSDQFLPMDQAERIGAAFDRSDSEMHIHAGAGHAFDNFRAPMFHHAPARDAAWPQTTAFLGRHFPSD